MARAPRGNSAVRIEVRGIDGIRKALRPLLEPELSQGLDRANKKGAQTFAKALRPAVKVESSRMAKAVRVKRAKTGKPGWVVGSKRKVAFFWPFVIGGTRAHGTKASSGGKLMVFTPKGGTTIRTRRVRGVVANPIVERVARSNEQRVANQIDQDVMKATGL